MADRAVSELTAATSVTATDLFVLEQSNTAKKLTGQILENWLVALADGHGGIQTVAKTGTSSLVDTYTITYADTTTSTFTVTNGKAISSITDKWARSQDNDTPPESFSTTIPTLTSTYKYLWHYQTIAYNDGSSADTGKAVVGVYGDTGQAWYMWVKYSAVQPTRNADMGDTPDKWIGIYSGTASSAPTSYSSYTWYQYKGEKGDPGNGISSVAKTGTSGLVDTYTITFTEGNTTTFTLTNGSSIQSISKTGTLGLVDTYTVALTNGSYSTFEVTNAKSITNITLTSGTHAPGTSDVYTINYNDGTSADFQVYNGANGTGAVSTVDGISPVLGDAVTLQLGGTSPTTSTVGQVNQRYFDTTGRLMYVCTSADAGVYTWVQVGGAVGSVNGQIGTVVLDGADIYVDDTAASPVTIKATLESQSSQISGKITEPASDGTDGQVLATNGSGLRYWKTVSGGGSGEQFYETVPVSAWYQQTPDVNEEYWYAADITPADFDPNEQDVSVCAADGNAYKWLSENAFYELNIGTTKFSIQAKAIPPTAIHVFYELKTRGESE